MTPDVSIIIVNFNSQKLTSDCIESVFAMTEGISFEVILIDNASSDGSRETFFADSRIRYIYNEENLGFGRANNKGLEIASGRNILFLNNDTVLLNNAVKILSDYLDSHPRAGVCGGNLFSATGSPMLSFTNYGPSIYAEISRFFKYIPDKMFLHGNREFNDTGKAKVVWHITGADLMTRKEILDNTGGFDPAFFMYLEDTELCRRIRKCGYRIVSVPDARIMHLEGASFREGRSGAERKAGYYEKSRKTYLELTHGNLYIAVMNAIHRLTLATRFHKKK